MLLRLVLSIAGGLLLWAAFPSIGWWWSAPLGVACVIAATRGARVGGGFALGFLAGATWFVPYVSWTGLHVGAMPWFALAALESFFVGLFGMGVALVSTSRGDVTGWGRRVWSVLVLASLWSATEWLRASMPFGGFPWGRVAYSQAQSPLLHLAAIGGPALIGFVVALCGALGLAVLDALRRGAAAPGQMTGRQSLLRVLPPVAFVAGMLLLPPLIPLATDGTPASLMVIQGDAPQAGLDFNANRRQILDNHARVTREAATKVDAGELPRPDLVVWPENASDIDPFVNPDAGRLIDEATNAVERPVLVGAVVGGTRSNLTNTSILWQPGVGATAQRYDKRALVPFAEYMPYRAFFRAITSKVDLLERDFVPGHTPGVISVPTRNGAATIHAGLGICFEVAVDHVMDDVAHRANLLVIQTNNAMFDRSAESAQQLAISQVRAVQYGRSVVHSSNVGISALITPDGVAHQATDLFTPAVISGSVPLREGVTPAMRLGIVPDAAFTGMALLGLLTAARSRHQGPRGARR